jgi:hypothetical protein
MFPAALLLVLVSFQSLLSSSLAIPAFANAIPHGNVFGVLTGHSSSSGGKKCASAALHRRRFLTCSQQQLELVRLRFQLA